MFSSQEFNLFCVLNESFWMKQFVKAALVQQYITFFLLKSSQLQYSGKTRNKPNNSKREKKVQVIKYISF